MIKYKLTNQNLQTYNGFQWEIGKKVTTSGEGNLCSDGWLHFYHTPELAVLLNPIHANIGSPRLFEVEVGETCLDDKGLKGGTTEMTLIKELELPVISLTQKIAFGILCAKEIYKDQKWNEWADNWLTGKDRTRKSAADAAAYAATAAYAAAAAAAYAAAAAAYAAADAAYAAADAAAADAAAADAAAAYAATAAAILDLQIIVQKALQYV